MSTNPMIFRQPKPSQMDMMCDAANDFMAEVKRLSNGLPVEVGFNIEFRGSTHSIQHEGIRR